MTKEQKASLQFLMVLVVAAAPFIISPVSASLSTKVAASGGFIALLGVIAIARSVLRVGVLTWMSKTIFSKFPELREEPTEYSGDWIDDQIYQNVFGPILVGLGTFLSGISGYFG